MSSRGNRILQTRYATFVFFAHFHLRPHEKSHPEPYIELSTRVSSLLTDGIAIQIDILRYNGTLSFFAQPRRVVCGGRDWSLLYCCHSSL